MASKIKKGLLYVILSILVFINIPINVYSISQETTSESTITIQRSEEVSWYYRDVAGGKQKRLWSHTYGRWLTDWISV